MFRRVKNRFLRYIIIGIYCIVLLTCAVQLNFLGLFGYSPTQKDIVMPTLNVASELYTADSVLIGRYFDEDRDPVAFDSIAPEVVNARSEERRVGKEWSAWWWDGGARK